MPDGIESGLSRRELLKAGAAGTFLLAFRLPVARADAAVFAPDAFIRVTGDGKVTLIMPQVEMGQGVYTATAMILAEELDADLEQVRLEAAPPNEKLYANPILGVQATGSSSSIRAWWTPMREAAASARTMLVEAAAQQWHVDAATCTASMGQVTHRESGRRLSYGALAAAASQQMPPKNVRLKTPKEFVYIGQPIKRLDTPDKANGKAVYGIDVILPGMKFATVAACPLMGGKVRKVDDSAVRKIPGVQKIVVLDDMVAVVGDHTWAAKSGLDALQIDWDEGPNAAIGSEDVWRELRAASAKDGVVAKSVGNVATRLSAGERFEASYELPFLAHATMEPINCTVQVKPDSCEVWIGTQAMPLVQTAAAKAAGLPVDKVVVNNYLLGGGFGRKLEADMASAAVRVAKLVDGPVKVTWTREEDIQHDVYRPVYRDTIAASVSNGKIVAWKYKVAGSSVMARYLPPGYRDGIDIDAVDSAVDMPYEIPNFQVEYVRVEPPAVTTGFWRGVGPNNNVFAIECFIDELARKVGKDPVAFRRSMLGGKPRFRTALDLAAEKSGWGAALPTRVGRGVSLQPSFASFIATVVEAEVDEQNEVHLRRVTCAVDTGIAVNPDTIVAQLEGGLIFGLTAALYGEITIDRGRVQQSNFNDYRMLRIDQAPKIEVHVVKSREAPGGIGETGTTAGPPALRNAVYAATGVALRRLPIKPSLIAAGTKA